MMAGNSITFRETVHPEIISKGRFCECLHRCQTQKVYTAVDCSTVCSVLKDFLCEIFSRQILCHEYSH